ncbi:acyltransferase [Intrasporangium sp. YIM S08009]|uniref:acyltransferase family protein n=1 Tax=Intrasporangium zincisolvens TaxID=3080018 RepID=UPI002B05CA65|nr:acyltransferase [Intrasporangium sp. YIM S08009]
MTSLRFVAAMLVVVFHLSVYLSPLPFLGQLMRAGYVGVTFFFVLSGFVLTYSWDSEARATRFYRRRFARVYPVHLFFVVVAMLPFNPTPNWAALPANVLLVQSWSPDDAVARSFTGVSWSLSCELFFYAVFPLLVRWLMRVRGPLAMSALLVVLAGATGVALQTSGSEWGLWLFHLPAFRIVEFICGALAATAVMRGTAPRVRVRWASSSVAISYLGILILPVLIGYRLEDQWGLSLAMVPGFVALIVACAHLDLARAPSPLRSRTAVSLGQWSFCIYMAHPAAIAVTRPLLTSPSPLGAVLGCLLVAMTVIGVSYLVYTTYERPLERWLRGSDDVRVSDEPTPQAGAAPPWQPQLARSGRSSTWWPGWAWARGGIMGLRPEAVESGGSTPEVEGPSAS